MIRRIRLDHGYPQTLPVQIGYKEHFFQLLFRPKSRALHPYAHSAFSLICFLCFPFFEALSQKNRKWLYDPVFFLKFLLPLFNVLDGKKSWLFWSTVYEETSYFSWNKMTEVLWENDVNLIFLLCLLPLNHATWSIQMVTWNDGVIPPLPLQSNQA